MQQLLVDKGALVQNYEAQLGFTGIAVAFLGQNNPIGIVFAAIFWGVLSRGESALQIRTEVPREFVIILQGIFIMTVVIVYQVAKRWAARRQLAREGWWRICRTPPPRPTSRASRRRDRPDVPGRLRRRDPDRLHVLHDHLPSPAWAGCSASDRAS